MAASRPTARGGLLPARLPGNPAMYYAAAHETLVKGPRHGRNISKRLHRFYVASTQSLVFLASKRQMQELVESAALVAGERFAIHEAVPAIQGQRRFESGAAARLQAEADEQAGAGFGDHMA